MINRRSGAFLLSAILVTVYCFAAVNEPVEISLREYVDMRFAEMQRAIDMAYKTNETDKAKMNEIRGALNDAQKSFASKEAVEKIQEDIKTLRSLSDIAQGKASQTSLFFVGMISVLSLGLQVARFFAGRPK